jgi:hypothetical protein
VGRGGALQEVTGDAAVLVDPLDVANIAVGMTTLAGLSDEERNNRVILLRRSVTRFSLASAVAAWRSALILAADSQPNVRNLPGQI